MDRQELLKASAVAARNLRANLRPLKGPDGRERTLLVAGPGKYHSVWTRDFCFAAGGLLAAGEARAVRDTLDAILARQRPDGLLPRLLDSFHPGMRFARAVLGGLVPLREPLAPNFLSDQLVTAVDSNSLVVWTAAHYALRADNLAWAGLALPKLDLAMAAYDALERDGLVHQPPCSDWKDKTPARRGAVFFTQLLRWRAMRSLEDLCRAMGRARTAATWKDRARTYARRLHRGFWDAERGFFADSLKHRLLSSEANLAAAAWGFADETQAAAIVRAMDRLGLWTPWGPRTSQRYPLRGKSPLIILAGVPGYGDDFVRLWISALALRVLHRLGKRTLRDRIALGVCGLLNSSGRVSEVYRPEDGREVRAWLYRSESPFSWSAGMLLEAFHELAAAADTPQQAALAGGGR
ncbi:MAG: hypothetical protein ABII00_10410 [Elusimicrobiota bacterium]